MTAVQRRGWCPSLSAPMVTGDGLLARLTPSGATIALDAFDRLCVAAREHGNGILEVTARGNIQVRGLSGTSQSKFASCVEALGLDTGWPQVLTPPLADLGSGREPRLLPLASALRRAIAQAPFTGRLAAKASIVVDGENLLHLDAVLADIRLREVARDGAPCFHVAVAGDATSACALGAVRATDAIACVLRLLETLCAIAPDRRMREALRKHGSQPFRDAMAAYSNEVLPPPARKAKPAIGTHYLDARRVAIGVGLPFGFSDSETLRKLISAARDAGAAGLRTAPDRVLVVVDLAAEAAPALVAELNGRGFVVNADDPRRRIVACAGAPICASGQIPTRALAPSIAKATERTIVDASEYRDVIHLSGCGKACAYPRPARLAVFGRAGACDVFIDGKLLETIDVADLPTLIARLDSSLME